MSSSHSRNFFCRSGWKARPQGTWLVMVAIGLVAGLVFLPGIHDGREWFGTSQASSQSPQFSPVQPVSILAAGRGTPVVQVNDSQPAYSLTKAVVTDDGSANLIPLALVAGDFNQDGVPDVVSTSTDGFQGMVNVHLGNLDGLYANSEEVQARVAAGQGNTDSFFPPLPAVAVPEPAQFVGTGDFNFDGKMDLVTAANGGTALYWLAGDGQGGFAQAVRIEVDGLITAFACGEFNQADGAVDVVVGVNRGESAAVLVYESAAEGLFGNPKVISMESSVAGLALGRFNNDSWFDLAAASGSSLMVVPGRDRLSVVNEPSLTAVPMSQRTFSEPLAGVTPGRFVNTTHDDIAVTTVSGQVLVLDDVARRRSLATEEEKPKKPIPVPEPVWLEQWKIHELGWLNPGAKLVKTKTSSLPMDDLLTVGGGGQLRLLTAGPVVNQKLAEIGTELAEFSAFNPPIAALPMRLNQDGLDDLVILSEGNQPLSKLTTTPMATFTVTNTGDNGGVDPAPSAGTGTLRQAIVDANANAGADMITFNIAGSGVQTITLAAALPLITSPVTIDGTTQPGSSTTAWPPTLLIELNGTSVTTGSGLSISGGVTNCLLKGLIINRFTASDAVTSGIGIRNGGDNNTIQYNLIGTDSTGNTALSNRNGVIFSNAINSVIGGSVAGTRNLVSGSVIIGPGTGDGIVISGSGSSGNLIRGNIIGLNAAGTADLGNARHGVGGSNGSTLTIGGPSANDRNIISGNESHGIFFIVGTSTLIQSNYIGTDINGTADLGNGGNGVEVDTSGAAQIGGSTATPGTAPGNVISGNNNNGILIADDSADGTMIQGNIIGLSAAGTADLGNTSDGVEITDSADTTTIGGTTAMARNVISGNDGNGIEANSATSTGTVIQGNFIGTAINGTAALGNSDGIFINNAPGVQIGGTTATPGTAPGNVISGNNSSGIVISGDSADGTAIQGNIIGLTAAGTADLGNSDDGVDLNNNPDNTLIGGTTAMQRNVISGNDDNGIANNNPGTTGTMIQSNFIGTDINGTADLGNTASGIVINSAPGTQIGGSPATPGTAPGNVISGNNSTGITITNDAADGTTIQGNIIGLSAAGTADVGNTNEGVRITSSADNTLIGGTAALQRNVISGNNGNGIESNDSSSSGTIIQGNFIGTDITGTTDLGNSGEGITISESPGIQIGGSPTTPGMAPGNVISGNNDNGIEVSGENADGTTIQGNIIGLSSAGTADLGNTTNGIRVATGADNTLIGGTTAMQRNVISGNDSDGIEANSAASTGTVIQGNFIGTNLNGTAALGNTESGISISDTPGTQIGGSTATPGTASGNVISGNSVSGIAIINEAADNTTIRGNIIGLDAAGTADLGNNSEGVRVAIGADNTQIGGTSAMDRNIISGNNIAGIQLGNSATTGTLIHGNFIGTDITGTADVGNSGHGILIVDTPGTQIGNSTATPGIAPGNVISGNDGSGISISNDPADGTMIRGNIIGLNAAGTADLGNTDEGIRVVGSADNTVIGGSTAMERNVISGNNSDGIEFQNGSTTGTTIHGNFIGTNINGTVSLGNSGNGIFIMDAPGTQIGNNTATPGTPPGNVISGNTQDGIRIQTDNADGTTIRGNVIGVNAGGASLGNGMNGVRITTSADNSVIGGTVSGDGNVIAFQAGSGVRVESGTGNQILGNSIHTNTILGIDLNGNDVVDANDTDDPDAGGNNLQNFPVLNAANSNGVNTQIIGTLNSTPSRTFRIEFFRNPACAGVGNGQGQTFLGSTTATTDSGGDASFDATLAMVTTLGQVVTATATDQTSLDTSEFSACRIITPAPPTLTKTFTPDQIPLGGTSTLSFTVTNPNSNSSLSNIGFSDTLPAGLVVATPNGLTSTCSGTVTAVPGSTVITYSGGGLTASGSCTFSVNVLSTAAGVFVNTTGAITSTEGGTGGTATDTITVVAPPTLAKVFAPDQIPLGGTSTLTFTVTNPNSTVMLTGIGFTDTLPAGLVVATPNGVTGTCSGTVTAIAGSNSISLSGASLAANGSCTFSVNVVGTAAGVLVNTTGAITSTEGGTGGTATDTITVVGPATLTKEFEPSTIQLTETTTLTFTMTNPNSTVTLTGLGFTDTLPDGLFVADPNGLTSTCNGTVVAVPGSTVITYSGGSLTAGASCTFSVTIQALTFGTKLNTTSTISSNEGGAGSAATATLIVDAIVELGNLYVADTINNRVQTFDGAVWTQVGPTGLFKTPEAVTADVFGERIYVADTGNNRIQWSTDSGVTWAVFATIGSATSQVRAPQGLALDIDGNLFVSDTGNNRVLRFAGGVPGSADVLLTSGSGSAQVKSPHGIAVDTLYNLFVADFGNNRVLKVTGVDQPVPTGTQIIATIGSASTQVRQPQGVGVDNTGNLYVADTGNNRILCFVGGNPGPAVVFATIGSALGQVRAPEGVTVNRFMTGPLAGISFLSVGDTANHRIVGRPLDTATWQLVGVPNNVGSSIGQFRSPSKIR